MLKTLVAAVMFTGLALAGCDPLDAQIDCNSICTRYADCYDTNYDVGGCESRCEDHSANDTDYLHTANECNACIDGDSCSQATFNCAGQCNSVVP